MEPLRPEDPRRVGDYRLLRRLGAGGMGQVFLGRTAGGRTVAVKTVRGQYAADHDFRERFRLEVAAARRVGGSWTAPVLDADTDSEQPWVATGYVAGPDLAAAVRQFGPLPDSAVRTLGEGLARALATVHGLGLVHRDVKPSNVLLALDGPRLIDFGIARALEVTSLTQTGMVVGSPGYMSPEQARGGAAGAASDVFSLGAVLAYAATGVPPFGEGVSAAVLLYRVLHETPELGPLGGELRDLVTACLAKDPERRPGVDEIRDRLAGGPVTQRLGHDGWLPPAVSASLAKLAVELLNLDDDTPVAAATVPPAVAGQPAPWPASGPYSPGAAGAFGPATPWPGATGPVRRGHGATIAIAGSAVVVVLLAGLLLAHSLNAGSGSHPDPAHSTHAVTGASTGPGGQPSASPDGAIPTAYLGTWSGELTSPVYTRPFDFRITVTEGEPGDPVGSVRNSSGVGDGMCDSTALLTSADTARLVLKTAPTGGASGCQADPAPQVYTLKGADRLHLEVDGLSGDLTRQDDR